MRGGAAGILPGDIIYAVDGVEIDTRYGQQIYAYIKLQKKVGDRVRFSVLRGGKDGERLEISYELGPEPHTLWAEELRNKDG